MARTERNFGNRDAAEQRWLVAHTWCDHCAKADLGLTEPVEYEEGGQILVEVNASTVASASSHALVSQMPRLSVAAERSFRRMPSNPAFENGPPSAAAQRER